jgi:hypothetical protein
MTGIPRGIKADFAYSYRKLEAAATGFRQRLGLGPTDRLDGLEFFDNLPDVSVCGRRYEVRSGVDHLDGVEAEASFDPELKRYQVVLLPEIYDRLENGNPHGTWVLVHEFAHVTLHGRLLQRLAKMEVERRAALYKGSPHPHQFYMDTEWQTDSFTAAALMPAAGIAELEREALRTLGTVRYLADSVAQQFGTSAEAAEYRCDTFKRRRSELLR